MQRAYKKQREQPSPDSEVEKKKTETERNKEIAVASVVQQPASAEDSQSKPSSSSSLSRAPVRSGKQRSLPSTPPRPSNAWILYRADIMRALETGQISPRQAAIRDDIVSENADTPQSSQNKSGQQLGNISRVAAALWKAEEPKIRATYVQRSEECRVRHRELYPDYKFQPKRRQIRGRLESASSGEPESSEAQNRANQAKVKGKRSAARANLGAEQTLRSGLRHRPSAEAISDRQSSERSVQTASSDAGRSTQVSASLKVDGAWEDPTTRRQRSRSSSVRGKPRRKTEQIRSSEFCVTPVLHSQPDESSDAAIRFGMLNVSSALPVQSGETVESVRYNTPLDPDTCFIGDPQARPLRHQSLQDVYTHPPTWLYSASAPSSSRSESNIGLDAGPSSATGNASLATTSLNWPSVGDEQAWTTGLVSAPAASIPVSEHWGISHSSAPQHPHSFSAPAWQSEFPIDFEESTLQAHTTMPEWPLPATFAIEDRYAHPQQLESQLVFSQAVGAGLQQDIAATSQQRPNILQRTHTEQIRGLHMVQPTVPESHFSGDNVDQWLTAKSSEQQFAGLNVPSQIPAHITRQEQQTSTLPQSALLQRRPALRPDSQDFQGINAAMTRQQESLSLGLPGEEQVGMWEMEMNMSPSEERLGGGQQIVGQTTSDVQHAHENSASLPQDIPAATREPFSAYQLATHTIGR